MRMALASPFFLSQHELSYDWPSYVASLHLAAGELSGARSGAAWDKPPTARTHLQ